MSGLKLAVVGKDGLAIFVFNLSVNIVLGDFHNQREHNHNADKVGHHHKAVESIRNVPSQGRGENCAQNNGANMDNSEDNGGFCTKEIFPSLGAVVRPAENGGKGKEEHGDCDESLADIAPREDCVERAAYEGCIVKTCAISPV